MKAWYSVIQIKSAAAVQKCEAHREPPSRLKAMCSLPSCPLAFRLRGITCLPLPPPTPANDRCHPFPPRRSPVQFHPPCSLPLGNIPPAPPTTTESGHPRGPCLLPGLRPNAAAQDGISSSGGAARASAWHAPPGGGARPHTQPFSAQRPARPDLAPTGPHNPPPPTSVTLHRR